MKTVIIICATIALLAIVCSCIFHLLLGVKSFRRRKNWQTSKKMQTGQFREVQLEEEQRVKHGETTEILPIEIPDYVHHATNPYNNRDKSECYPTNFTDDILKKPQQQLYFCRSCGAKSIVWSERCPKCSATDSMRKYV